MAVLPLNFSCALVCPTFILSILFDKCSSSFTGFSLKLGHIAKIINCYWLLFPYIILFTCTIPQVVIVSNGGCGLFDWSLESSARNLLTLISWRGHEVGVSFFYDFCNLFFMLYLWYIPFLSPFLSKSLDMQNRAWASRDVKRKLRFRS